MVKPTLVRYEAPGWGVGEVWLEGELVVWAELPRPRPERTALGTVPGLGPNGQDGGQSPVVAGKDTSPGRELGRRLTAFFAGRADDFADIELDLEPGFYGDCARALRAVPRGEVVTYGELAALAGRPGAARAAGTFCGRNRFSPFVPCHRVVSAGGIGSYGSLGIDYKRRLLALEDVAL